MTATITSPQMNTQMSSVTTYDAEHAALPRIIQGGTGAAVSNWRLANAVARSRTQ